MRHTLIILMEDKPGVLSRVSSLIRRRNFNIESLTVGHSETAGISRLTVVVGGDDAVVEQLSKQLYKLIHVTKVVNVTEAPAVVRELALIKVHATANTRSEIMQLVDIFRAKAVDVGTDSLMVEITGQEDKIDTLASLLRPFGIKEMARTGRVAMARGPAGHGALRQASREAAPAANG